ncbi:LysE/ArgO family amino acid transporter [Humibacter albus]|uniref:LysE/ArgO family amino acid transporter n=1 Tax=Humibacter albus TaxID=427754 RepID=UPI0003B6CF25|nr:LysE/ArgO family amino acid transporter [Humibacter albus]
MHPLATVFAGLGFSLSLIVAIGAQNAFVLRQGLRREHVLPIVLVCAGTDALLIFAGIAGVGVLVLAAPWLLVIVRWVGVAFLVVYGVLAARRAWHPGELDPASGSGPAGLGATLAACLAFTWLNPHVYLDTVVLMGTIGNGYGESRWWFALGAALASALWFTALGFGARMLRPVFRSPVAWRVLDVLIAVTMFVIAATLALEVLAGS